MGISFMDKGEGHGKAIIGITCGHTFDGSGRFYVNEPYVRCIEAVGGLPFLIPGLDDGKDIERLLGYVDGVLLPGGVDVDPMHFGENPMPSLGDVNPMWDDLELHVARVALQRDLPVLGICRGVQVLNVAAGGSLYQDIPSQIDGELCQHSQRAPRWYPIHGVMIELGSVLEKMLGPGEVRVNSFHHQAIKELAPGFRMTAKSGDGVIEAVESKSHTFALGVQWHPEHMVEYYPRQLEIFRRFVEVSSQKRKGEV